MFIGCSGNGIAESCEDGSTAFGQVVPLIDGKLCRACNGGPRTEASCFQGELVRSSTSSFLRCRSKGSLAGHHRTDSGHLAWVDCGWMVAVEEVLIAPSFFTNFFCVEGRADLFCWGRAFVPRS